MYLNIAPIREEKAGDEKELEASLQIKKTLMKRHLVLFSLIGLVLLFCAWQCRIATLIDEMVQEEPSHAFCSRRKPPLVCAHGGDHESGHPPNTKESFEAAVALKVDCVEVDVSRTKDGSLVVLHSRELQELLRLPRNEAIGSGIKASQAQAGDLTMRQVDQLRWPRGEKVLSVRDAILLSSGNVEMIILDIKLNHDGSDEEALVDQLIRTVHDLSCGNCLIWAKEDRVVSRLKKISPGQKCGYICMNETEKNREDGMHDPLRMMDPEIVGMHHEMVSLYHSKIIQGAKKGLIAWTTNSEPSIRKVLSSSIDGLVTNFPRLALWILEDLMIQCGRGQVEKQVEL